MATPLFAFLAHKDGLADDAAFELLAAARALFPGSAPIALLAGAGPALEAACRSAAEAYGEVWKFDQEALAYPNAELLRPLLVKALPPGSVLLMAHSTLGMDLGPGLSVKLGAVYVPDVVGGEGVEGGTLKATRQEFNGQVHAHLACDVSGGAVITVRAGAFRPDEDRSRQGQVVDHSADAVGIQDRRQFKRIVQPEAGDIDITREDVLVSVGRGIGDRENLELVQDLADAMGAAVACSRPLVDAKWLEKPRQVGTSGQTVKPKVYLALGISGSFQHLGGLKGNPYIVAVNTNPKAPIFQAASVGVVADLLELVPALTERIKQG